MLVAKVVSFRDAHIRVATRWHQTSIGGVILASVGRPRACFASCHRSGMFAKGSSHFRDGTCHTFVIAVAASPTVASFAAVVSLPSFGAVNMLEGSVQIERGRDRERERESFHISHSVNLIWQY